MNNVEKNGFRELKLCDSHIHLITPDPLERTTNTFREIIKYFSFDRIALMGVTRSTVSELDPANNVKALYLKSVFNSETPDSTFVYGSPLHFYDERDTAEGYLEQVRNLYEMGVDGYKILDGKPEFRKKARKKLCDPIYDKMYAFIEEKGLPLKMHVADPPEFWKPKEMQLDYVIQNGWWCGDGTFPSFQELHDEVYEILEKFPKLKLCAAHCFYLSHDIEQLTEFFEKWENTSVDLTPGTSIFREFTKKPEEWKAFFKKYKNRIFFGTDIFNDFVEGDKLSKYEDYWTTATTVRKMLEKPASESFDVAVGHLVPMNLDDEIVSDIYFNNHLRLHPETRPINKEMVLKESQKLLNGLQNGEFKLDKESRYSLEAENLKTVIDYFSRI